MAVSRNKKKAPAKKKAKHRIFSTLLLLFGIGGLLAFIFAIFVMEEELNRIGFFTKVKKPLFQAPTAAQRENPATPPTTLPASPAVVEPSQQETSRPQGSVSARVTENISPEDRKRLQDLTSSRSTENLSQDDRQRLEDILRSR
jgi:hypothetical protein